MCHNHHKPEDPIRRLLLQVMMAGAMSGVAGRALARDAVTGKSIHQLAGTLVVNGALATQDTLIRAGDVLETGRGSHAVFVVGRDAFILRDKSRLEISGDNLLIGGLRLVTGGLLSVFGKKRVHITTPTATIGIRGTGVYLEASAEQTYFCTCYGTTEVAASDLPAQHETITTNHHSARYILASGDSRISTAPLLNHTDLELALLESLVGRKPPFAGK